MPLTITVGDFTSCKEPRDGACVSVPSPLHPSACTQGHSGLCARPSLRLTLGGTLMDFCFRRSSISLIPFTTPSPPLLSISLSPSISFFLSHIPTHTHTHSLPLAVSLSHCCRYDSEKLHKLLLCYSLSLLCTLTLFPAVNRKHSFFCSRLDRLNSFSSALIKRSRYVVIWEFFRGCVSLPIVAKTAQI